MPSVLFSLAMRARRDGDAARAEALLSDAVASDAEDADALLALAALHEETGRLAEAALRYQGVLGLRPGDVVTQASLGHVLARLGRYGPALEWLRRAVEGDPGSASALASLGATLAETGRAGEAEAVLRRALALDPGLADALNHLGNALHLQGRHREAIEAYRAAVAAKPDFAAAHGNLIYTLSLDPDIGPEGHKAERDAWWLAHGARHAALAAERHANDPDPDRRLRVGYVSGHFRRESAAMSFAPVLLAHDRSAVDVICYSGTERVDDLTETLRSAAASWRETGGLDDDALARLVRADRVDILVDLAGHMYGNRLPVFARRPAPVQISAWGEPTGTGLPTIDALFSDPVHIPNSDRHLFAERVIDLPCHIHYGRPAATPPIVLRPRGGAFVFGSLNRMAKLGDTTLALWREVLDAAPEARLLLKDTAFGETAAREHVLARLGHSARVEFRGGTPQAEHLGAYNDMDVALDPTPQNGGVTTFEALWLGVPAIALRGRTPASRTSAAILAAAGLDEFVAADREAYVAKARAMVHDRDRLALLRRQIPERLGATALGDAARYARAVEARYRELWRAWCATR